MSKAEDQQFQQAMALHRSGDTQKAKSICQQLLGTVPAHAGALYLLGTLAYQGKEYPEAIPLLERAMNAAPRMIGSYIFLGKCLQATDRAHEAIRILKNGLAVDPAVYELHITLAAIYRGVQQPAEAENHCRNAIRLKPDVVNSYLSLGDLLEQQGRHDEARNQLEEAIRIQPNCAEAYNNLGNTLTSLGETSNAEAMFRKAIALQPSYMEPHYNLGSLFRLTGKLTKSAELLTIANKINPGSAQILNNLATVCKDQGKITEAIVILEEAIQCQNDFAKAHSNLVFYKNFLPEFSSEDLYHAHCQWATQQALDSSASTTNFQDYTKQDHRLRVAYISPDFREHSVAYYFYPLLSNHSKDIETFLYSDAKTHDAMSDKIREAADHWTHSHFLGDEELIDQVRADGIDILMDLAGHTGGNRLLMFARKVAPIQYTYLGYPCTTGLNTIDYRISDSIADPEGESDACCTEQLVRIKGGFLCYQAPEIAPEVSGLPADSNGFITFGSFNNRAKITPDVVKSWCAILQDVPNSRLVLKCRCFNDNGTQQEFLEQVRTAGVDADRITLHGSVEETRQHLAMYDQIDIALDTFPYNGTTTTCEALWMGVPVLTLSGATHASRVGSSILERIGLESWITNTRAEYLEKATHYASDLNVLASLRKKLRQRMLDSSLCDGPRIAREIERVYFKSWEKWCKE